jgi:hypothetical protein
MGDGLLGGSVNKSWDGIWEARVARGEWGWSAEIRIPFSTLNFDPGLDTWGINFQRTIRRRNEEILWSGWRRNQGLFRTTHAGRLTSWADPFFSRRIGLVEGQEVPIRYGARLGGKVGRYELGVYQVRTGERIWTGAGDRFRPAEDFTVGRVKRSLFQQSHVGVIYTRRSRNRTWTTSRAPDRHTIGRGCGPLHLPGPRALQRPGRGVHRLPHRPACRRRSFPDQRMARGYRMELPERPDPAPHLIPGLRDRWDPARGLRAAAWVSASPAHPHDRAPPGTLGARSDRCSGRSTSSTSRTWTTASSPGTCSVHPLQLNFESGDNGSDSRWSGSSSAWSGPSRSMGAGTTRS